MDCWLHHYFGTADRLARNLICNNHRISRRLICHKIFRVSLQDYMVRAGILLLPAPGSVVQPDLAIICDRSKLDKRVCKGAPDLIVEIILPATAKKDMQEKFLLYERSGVKEY